MILSKLLNRWREKLAARSAARKKFEAIIYFEGPHTKWTRRQKDWLFVEPFEGVRIPLHTLNGVMPPPDDREIVLRKSFRSQKFAMGWVRGRLHGFDKSKIVGEVRPL